MWTLFLASLVALWKPAALTWQDVWIERWGWVIALTLMAFIWRLPWKSKLYPVALSLVALLATASAFSLQFHSAAPALETQLYLRQASLYGLAALGAFLAFMHLKIDMVLAEIAFKGLGLLAFGCIFMAEHPTVRVPVFANHSIACTFVALMWLFGRFHPLAGWGLVCLSIALTHSWSGAVTIVVGLLAMLARDRRGWHAVGWGAAIAIVGGWYLWTHPGAQSGRFGLWKDLAVWWAHSDIKTVLLGSGLGTTRVWLPSIMFSNGDAKEYGVIFYWVHNDWLQMIVELGAVTGLAAVAACVHFVLKSSRTHWPFLFAFAAAMLINFPLHMAFTCLPLWFVIRSEALKTDCVSLPDEKWKR